MLSRYREAVKLMRDETKFPRHDPRSWKFQANIHWVHPEDNSEEAFDAIFSTSGMSNEQADAVKRHRILAIGTSSAVRTWATCQHTDNVEYFFLGWHRLYLWHFERIVASLVGDDFALPYWDYSQKNSSFGRALPPEFRVAINGSQAGNLLWYEHRDAKMNKESNPAELEESDVTSTVAFKADGLYKPGDMSGFSRSLNNAPHGNVHGAIGGSGIDAGMGSVPTAARDPIFWIHHCSIDRLWEMWRRSSKGKSDEGSFRSDWENVSFAFADRNGERTEMAVLKSLDLPYLEYDYDTVPLVEEVITTLDIQSSRKVMIAEMGKGESITVVGTGAVVDLATTPDLMTVGAVEISDASIELEIRATEEPSTSFNVFVKFPAQAALEQKEVAVGRFNVFGASTKNQPGGAQFLVTLDAASVLPELKIRGIEKLELRVSPVKGETTIPIKIDSVRILVKQRQKGELK
ncbi:tyrosinase family protein [Mesorhizobium sp. M0115]